MKPVEIFLRRKERRRKMEGVNLTKLYGKHTGRNHNATPGTIII
jgi:hypothetical protein